MSCLVHHSQIMIPAMIAPATIQPSNHRSSAMVASKSHRGSPMLSSTTIAAVRR
jgi:hypothetical protein